MPSCNGASMVFITRRRVAFKSDAVLRGTVSFLLQVISPRFCGMFSNYFPSVSREKNIVVALYNARHGEGCHGAYP